MHTRVSCRGGQHRSRTELEYAEMSRLVGVAEFASFPARKHSSFENNLNEKC